MQNEKQILFDKFINKEYCSDDEIKIIKKYIDEEASIDEKKKYAKFLISDDYINIYYKNKIAKYEDKELTDETKKKQIDIEISNNVITDFIDCDNNLNDFLDNNKLSYSAFNYYVNLVQLSNIKLYNEYLNKINFINKSNIALSVLKARLMVRQIKDGSINKNNVDEISINNLLDNVKEFLTKEEIKTLKKLQNVKVK